MLIATVAVVPLNPLLSSVPLAKMLLRASLMPQWKLVPDGYEYRLVILKTASDSVTETSVIDGVASFGAVTVIFSTSLLMYMPPSSRALNLAGLSTLTAGMSQL